MTQISTPLIAGAGPVGLAAAVFLAQDGVRVRIVDSADEPSSYSKALAVNPRTLEILEPSGITAQMHAIGMIVRGAHVWRDGEVLAHLNLEKLESRYPYMLALSQAATVRLLEAKLNTLGVQVERGMELIHCRNRPDAVEVVLRPTAGGSLETVTCPWLLDAEGAHSKARSELGIAFEGSSFKHPWYLVDLPLATALAPDSAHVFFPPDGGFLFVLRVIDGPEKNDGTDRLWRVLGNFPNLLEHLEQAKPTGPAVWTSSFNISHRINSRMQEGHVYFAGDAAHIHSPMGARGMNLGIEDAWVFSQLLKAGRVAEYGPMRRKIDRRVVRRVEMLSRMARGESAGARFIRNQAFPIFAKLGAARSRAIKTLTGMDHPLFQIAEQQKPERY